MASLADYLNTPRELELDGKTWHLRQPTIFEETLFQRWLETEAYRTIERRSYQNEQQKIEDIATLDESIKAGAFEYGGELAVQAMGQIKGIARMVSIVCRDQVGMTSAIAKQIVEKRFRDVELAFSSKMPQVDSPGQSSADPPSPRSDFLVWLCNPPFNRDLDKLERLSWNQLLFLFDVERTPEGNARIVPPSPGKRLTREGMFRRAHYVLGITDQVLVDELWAKEKARQAEADSKDPKKRHMQRRRSVMEANNMRKLTT